MGSDATKLVGQTITQLDVPGNASVNEASAIVENVFKFSIGGTTVTEIILGEDTIEGTFVAGQTIQGISNDDEDLLVKCTLEGIIATKTINNDGNLMSNGDLVTVTGGGQGAIIQVDTVGAGGITEIFVDNAGSGYAIGDAIVFSSGNASAKVSVVNGGIAPESGTSGASSTDHIVLEDETQRGDPYTGNKIVQESGTGSEDITDIRMIDNGNAYTSLPTLTITSSGGSSATVRAYGPEIGRVLSLKTIEQGFNYDASPSPPTLTLPMKMLVTGLTGGTGGFNAQEVLTGSSGATATVSSFDSGTGILTLVPISGTFVVGNTVTGGTTSTTATIRRFDQATATATADVVTTTDGAYINQDGHISETTMKIQDSLLYQDYSYIIKVGRSINDWRDTYSTTLHTSGFYFQGEVAIRTRLDAKLRNITGLNTGVVEVIQGVIKTIFTTLFGRRLGTTSDGTTLRANPLVGVDPDFTDSTTPPQLSSTTRDVTINAAYKLKFRTGGSVSISGVECSRGFLYSGYSYRTVNREPFRTFRDGIEIALESGIGSGHLLLDGTGHTANATNVDDENSRVLYEDNDIKGLTIAELNKLKIIGTGTSLDGDTALLTMLQNEQTRSFKTSLAIPSHITAVKS